MNERLILIKSTTLKFLQSKQKGTLATPEQIEELFGCGVITEKSALRYCIKNEYYLLLKHSDISHRSAVIDLSIKWDVSKFFIENLIYKTDNKNCFPLPKK